MIENTDAVLANRYAIFDMDGTLIDSNPWLSRISGQYIAKRGVTPNAYYENLAAGMTFVEFCQAIRDYTGDQNPLEKTIEEINRYISDVYLNCDIPAKPCVREYLEALRKNGTRMCVCSATESDRIESVLSRLKLRNYFEFVVTTTDVGCGKSKPDIFIEAARRFDTKTYSGITVYEDLLAAMRSAKSAGCRVVGIYDKVGESQIEDAKDVCDIFADGFDILLKKLEKIQKP